MRRIIYIAATVVLLTIISWIVYFKLPLEITRKSDIKFGNELIQKIENYKNEYSQLPLDSDWGLFEQFGFRMEMLGTDPSYSKINDDEYELIYLEGFDGPYLLYNSKEGRWKIDFPSIPNNADNQQENPQQKESQQEMEVNQNSLEDVIIKTIKAYQTQNEKTLNKLILKNFGIAFVYRRGVMDEFDISDKISFDEPVPEYLPFDYNIIITDYKIHFGKLPFFSCDTEKWNKPSGIYCDTINTDKALSIIAKFRNEYFESNYSEREMKKFEKIEKKCYRVIVIGKEGNEFIFSITFLENKWYLTIIDRFEACSA